MTYTETKDHTFRLSGVPIKFDDKHISERTGKRIPLDIETNEPHDCPARRDSHNSNNHSKCKGDTINVTKAAAKRSTLMQITKAKAGDSFH